MNDERKVDPQIEDILLRDNTELDHLREQQSVIRGLQKHPGYQWMQNRLAKELEVKKNTLMGPPEDPVDEQKRTYSAGEAFALHRCVHYLELELQVIENSIRAREGRIERLDPNFEG